MAAHRAWGYVSKDIRKLKGRNAGLRILWQQLSTPSMRKSKLEPMNMTCTRYRRPTNNGLTNARDSAERLLSRKTGSVASRCLTKITMPTKGCYYPKGRSWNGNCGNFRTSRQSQISLAPSYYKQIMIKVHYFVNFLREESTRSFTCQNPRRSRVTKSNERMQKILSRGGGSDWTFKPTQE